MYRRIGVVLVACAVVGGACTPDTTAPPPGSSFGADCTSPPALVAGASLFGCNLAGLDLSGLNLSGADLHGSNLTGSDLTGANLTNANLTGANLTNANLTGANLTNAILSGAILLGALLINALLGHTVFDFGLVFGPGGGGGSGTTTLPGCTGPYCPGLNQASHNFDDWLCNPDLDLIVGDPDVFITATPEQLDQLGLRSVVTGFGTDFTGATFDYSGDDPSIFKLRGLDFSGANFTNATFIDAIFACSSLDNGRFSGATFTTSNLPGDVPGQFHHLRGRGADFSGATFQRQTFCDVDMTASNFTDTTWRRSGIACANILPESELDLLPQHLLLFDNADLTDARFDGSPDAGGPGYIAFGRADYANRGTSFAGATLTRTVIIQAQMSYSDFTGATAADATVTGYSQFAGTTFGTGWGTSTWTGIFDFTGATCPNGSTGGPGNPCF